MKKKTEEYTWNEDLQRVIKGTLPQSIEARQHDNTERYIDDVSFFLPRGKRRSEKFIETKIREGREDREKKHYEYLDKERKEIERQHAPENDWQSDDRPCDIPYNQNQASNFDLWLNEGGAVLILGLAFLLTTGLVAYLIQPK